MVIRYDPNTDQLVQLTQEDFDLLEYKLKCISAILRCSDKNKLEQAYQHLIP